MFITRPLTAKFLLMQKDGWMLLILIQLLQKQISKMYSLWAKLQDQDSQNPKENSKDILCSFSSNGEFEWMSNVI